MKKIISVFFVVMLLAAGTAFAQWDFESVFPPDTLLGSCHGLAVDPDGKIWVQQYYSTDSVQLADGSYQACRKILVYNPDGTPSSISGIKILTFPAGSPVSADTLWNAATGLGRDINGNILAVHTGEIYRINYQTGEGMTFAKTAPITSVLAPSCDDNGNILIGPVLPGQPAILLDPDFNVLGNAIDATENYARTIEISPDGNTVYWIPFTGNNELWTRADEFSPFAIAETDSNWLPGLQPESSEWHPITGDLWLSGGSFNNSAGPGWTNNTWYGIDVATGARTDSLKWVFYTPANADERPRAIAFSPDGNTAYIGCFGANDYPSVEKFVKTGDAVGGWEHVGRIDGYTLSQNYPNPFNPTTKIQFSVGKQGLTTLKVYDMLGREVATLINETLSMGTYNVEFDASNLPSGTYIYELRSGDRRLTEKMTLMK
jgi:DNA-binding beta-propeller fold protein YncE